MPICLAGAKKKNILVDAWVMDSWPMHGTKIGQTSKQHSRLQKNIYSYMPIKSRESWVTTVPAWNEHARKRVTFIPLLPLPCRLNKRGIRAMRSCYACKVRTHVKINKGSEMMEASEFWYGMGW